MQVLRVVLTTIVCVAGVASASDEYERRDFTSAEDRQYKFQRPDQVYPHRMARASDDVFELPRSTTADDFDVSYEFEGNTYSIDDFNERTRSNALLILKDGEIVKEIYRNGAQPETRFISWSTGKSYTAMLVGMAVEDGYIDSVDDQLTEYLPALIGSAYDGVTIKDALQMASGVEWDESSYDFDDLSKPLNRHWEHSIVQQRYRFVEGANELPRVHEPGTHYNYNTLETCILGWLVENATKKRMTTYFEERLWRPAGMEFPATWIVDGPTEVGREMAGGMLTATLRDYGRFGHMMASGGFINGRQVVSSDWVEEATTADREAVAHGNLYEDYPLGYGY